MAKRRDARWTRRSNRSSVTFPRSHASRKQTEKAKDEIISRRDERGTPYPGDFPNPASDRTRGCF